jgi:peptidoglycan hydrolase-like protein with peptidoglycan-binding domain
MDDVIRKAGGTVTSGPSEPSAPSGKAPPFPGTNLNNYIEGHGTSTWQGQMSARGWSISVDDAYGSESERVCTQFQSEKGLSVDGVVGPETWEATWSAPIT